MFNRYSLYALKLLLYFYNYLLYFLLSTPIIKDIKYIVSNDISVCDDACNIVNSMSNFMFSNSICHREALCYIYARLSIYLPTIDELNALTR